MTNEHPPIDEQADPIEPQPTPEDGIKEPTLNLESLSPEAALYIEHLKHAVQDAEDGRVRALADFKNFQRRSIENEGRARRDGAASVVRALLPALDNLDRALQNIDAAKSAEQVAQGITMVKADFSRALESTGIELIAPCPNDEFEPERHEAVAQLKCEGIEEGHVGETAQNGYALGEMILRPAKVVIATSNS